MSLPQGLRPGGLCSWGPWLNTPSSCFLQSLRLCHPKTDAQTSSCAVSPVPSDMLSPGLPTADLGSLGTAPACLEFTSLGLTRLQGIPSTRRTKPAQRAPWRHLGPGRPSLGRGGEGDDPVGRWSVGSPYRPAAETQAPREGEAVDTLVSRVPAHPRPGGKVLGLGTCGSSGSYSRPPTPGGAALPSELQSRRPV